MKTSKLKGVTGMVLTKGNKGFGRITGLGNTNRINSKNPHLIRHTLNHLLRLKCGLFAEVEVKSHPPGALLLLPLNEVSCRTEQHRRTGVGEAASLRGFMLRSGFGDRRRFLQYSIV